ncbi:MAG: hypothetical protein IKP60_06960 [Treponema sp.]|nr:hypothetical protein [Treponema sp.]
MKKLNSLILSICTICIGTAFWGCSSSINETYTLPNGTEITKERYDELQNLRITFEESYHSRSGNDDSIDTSQENSIERIEAMKSILIEKYGNEAYNYFGETDINYEQSPSNGRWGWDDYSQNFEVKINNPNYIGWANTKIIDHWGIWWDYKEFSAQIYYKNILYNERTKPLLTDTATLRYSDSNTSTKTIDYDWRYLDGVNPDPSFFGEVGWEVQNAGRGEVNTSGNIKWGWWFPKVTAIKADIDFYDVLIENGRATINFSH